jgi:hypothetical protein
MLKIGNNDTERNRYSYTVKLRYASYFTHTVHIVSQRFLYDLKVLVLMKVYFSKLQYFHHNFTFQISTLT